MRVRARITGTSERPRLVVNRSIKYTNAQIIDDSKEKTIISMSTKSLEASKIKGKTKKETAQILGELIAESALKAKVKQVVFDRSGYRYHGRVKALADGARKGGLSL